VIFFFFFTLTEAAHAQEVLEAAPPKPTPEEPEVKEDDEEEDLDVEGFLNQDFSDAEEDASDANVCTFFFFFLEHLSIWI
jgi:hypothetical protein